MKNNQKILIGILAIIVFVIIIYFVVEGNLIYKSLCSSHYTISCIENHTVLKNISCNSDSDCSISKMNEFCKPGVPQLLECVGARYYCGEDGFCKGCVCPF